MVDTVGKGCVCATDNLVMEARDTVKYPTMLRTYSHNKNYSAQNINSAKVEKPEFSPWDLPNKLLLILSSRFIAALISWPLAQVNYSHIF